ncbi:MAG: hypothetical protein ABI474_10265 [Actinomycetota bacterium]
MTPLIWTVLLATVVVAIGIGGKVVVSRRARAAAARALENARPVDPECRVNGHVYREFDTGWRCATCGNHVPRRDGELYGLVTDGKHERRREAR